MSTVESPVSDMLVTVKSRQIQRGMLAEMQGDRAGAAKYLLAAAHLELVLADDYAEAGTEKMAFRSRLSAASCFWRAGQIETARKHFAAMAQDFPDQKPAIDNALLDLEQNCPPASPKKTRHPRSRKKAQ